MNMNKVVQSLNHFKPYFRTRKGTLEWKIMISDSHLTSSKISRIKHFPSSGSGKISQDANTNSDYYVQ